LKTNKHSLIYYKQALETRPMTSNKNFKIERNNIIDTFNQSKYKTKHSLANIKSIDDILIDGDADGNGNGNGNRADLDLTSNRKFPNTYNSDSELSDMDTYPNLQSRSQSRSQSRFTGGAMDNSTSRSKYQRSMGREYAPQRETVDLEDNKIPICKEIILTETEIPNFSSHECAPITHPDVAYPLFSLGFNHWIHASKNKTDIFNTFTGKKRVYQVINGYERYVDDYDNSIGVVSKHFFGLGTSKDSRPNILSRAFYKLWEIFYFYDLIDLNEKNFVSAHLAEGPGSFIQACMFFREMFSKHSKSDKYHAITIHSESEDTSLDLEKEFVEYYAREKPQRFFMHKTFDAQTAGGSKTKDNGDLTKTKTLNNFKKDIGTKVDLVTGDGGFDWDNENIQEQECAVLIYGQILAALNIQKKGGHFILKVFEMFTLLSVKFVLLLKYFYEEVHIMKPFTSRESNSERYLVCRKFKFSEGQISGILKSMMDGLDQIDKNLSSNKNNSVFLFDIFPTIKIPDNLILNMVSINTEITNQQFRVINKMIEYLDGSNFHGEIYAKYRNRQITLTQYWIDVFMTESSDFNVANIKARKLFDQAVKIQGSEYSRFKNVMIGFDVPKDKKIDNKIMSKEPSKDLSKEPSKDLSKNKKVSRSKTATKTKPKSKSKTKSKSKSNTKTKSSTKTKSRATKKVNKTKTESKTKTKTKTKSTKTKKTEKKN